MTYVAFFAAIGLLALTSPALAGASLGERRTNVSTAEKLHDDTRLYRDKVMLGDRGVAKGVADWAEQANGWMASLDGLWANLLREPSQDIFTLRQKMNAILAARDADLRQLTSDGLQIATRSKNASDQLKRLAKPNWEQVLYPEPFHRVESAALALAADFEAINANTLANIDRLQQLQVPMEHKVALKLEGLALSWHIPEWETVRAKLAAVFAAEAVLRPLKSSIRQKTMKVQWLASDYKLHAAWNLWLKVESECALAIETIRLQNLAQDDIGEALRSIRGDCAAAKQAVGMMHNGPEAEHYYARAMVETMSTRLRTRCLQGDLATNCAKASWLVKIPLLEIDAMSQDNLKALETAWSDAETTIFQTEETPSAL